MVGVYNKTVHKSIRLNAWPVRQEELEGEILDTPVLGMHMEMGRIASQVSYACTYLFPIIITSALDLNTELALVVPPDDRVAPQLHMI